MGASAVARRFDGDLARRLIARAPNWLVYVLVVLIGLRAALLLSQLAGPPVAPITVTPPPAAPVRNVVDVPSILRANLFGQSPPAEGTGNAPVTSLTLLLGGVIAANDEKLGFAMVGTSGTDIKFYRVGDALPGGAQLHAVFVDRVLLDRGGSIEALLMPVRAGAPLPPPPQQTMVVNPAAQVGRVQQVMRENPALLRQILLPTAVTANGKLLGMRVNPGTNVQAYNRLGLKPGDLVTAINGAQLNDQTNAEEIFNTLSSAAEARITVTRNGTQQELHLNLAEIANEAERLSQTPAAPPTGMGQPPGPDSAR